MGSKSPKRKRGRSASWAKGTSALYKSVAERKAALDIAPVPDPPTHTIRACLACDGEFKSVNNGNRLCSGCKVKANLCSASDFDFYPY